MLQQLVRYDLSLCLLSNRLCRAHWIRVLFVCVSRLGDGHFWFALILVLPLFFGLPGLQASAHMMLIGLCGLAIYKLIKRGTERPRPYRVHEAIRLGTAPLDQYSFPSGHTLHAVGFTLVALEYFPQLVWLLAPFAALIAASRVVLGLHYPSDVLCGALIGASLALGSTLLL